MCICANKNKQIHTKKSHNHTNRQKIMAELCQAMRFGRFFGCGKSAEYWGLRFSLDKNHTPNEKKNKCSPTPSIKMINVRVVDLAPIFRSIGTICGFACFRTSFYRGQICNMNMAVSTSLTTQGHFGKQNWRVREHKLRRYKHIDMRWTIPTWKKSGDPDVTEAVGLNGWKGYGFRTTKKTTTHEKKVWNKRTSNTTLPASILSS